VQQVFGSLAMAKDVLAVLCTKKATLYLGARVYPPSPAHGVSHP
jgi:hypothetical protein